ncbi:carbon-nitrogen hydrolase family protein [Streptomyces litchfieldiae]|uniref:Carbon-nitrogen hydrolase family protein n=1 Tax=Streptomyces litchfieldiae TaxID=3075543 RepID=A0ABU2MI33_9ACTN|nr:carbon-nitrogen hydrolase family protein [Streptomyces sp. DSM 44938]MDT0341240.1 carbon-nitrogen hydrolase family protein [Streptomyces sp. DSM 44938]
MRIAASQLASGVLPVENLTAIAEQTARAAAEGADVVVFPEAAMARFGIPLGPVAEPLDGPWATRVRAIADSAGVLVVAGMFTPAEDGRVRNTLLITGRGVDTHYDKLHLFDAYGFAESATVAPGTEPVVAGVDGVVLGFATCYDVRFPGLFTRLADDGARIVLLPASWGAGPGKREQWETLVRARALDSTCWVVAAGQADPATVGEPPATTAPTGIGHSMAVSPFGEVRAALGAEPGLLLVDVDPAETDRARRLIPVLANRRRDVS